MGVLKGVAISLLVLVLLLVAFVLLQPTPFGSSAGWVDSRALLVEIGVLLGGSASTTSTMLYVLGWLILAGLVVWGVWALRHRSRPAR